MKRLDKYIFLIKITFQRCSDSETLPACTYTQTHTPVPAQEVLCWKHTSTRFLDIYSFFSRLERERKRERRLTVELGGGALSVGSLGGQQKGLVVQVAVWGGRFVVRPEFSRVHVAAQGEQRLAELPRNHRILEGAASAGRWEAAEGGGKKGGGKGRR